MLEEQLVRALIDKGAQVRITDLKFNEDLSLKGSIGPFKASFSDNGSIEEQVNNLNAICGGEGTPVGKDALKLLKKISQAKTNGILSKYELNIFIPNGCDVSRLILDGQAECVRVPYTEKQWENELKLLCEKPCEYQNICPSYQAKKAGKALYLSEVPKKD